MADVALCVYIYNTFEAYALKSLRTIFCLVNRQTISARLQLGVFTSFHPGIEKIFSLVHVVFPFPLLLLPISI